MHERTPGLPDLYGGTPKPSKAAASSRGISRLRDQVGALGRTVCSRMGGEGEISSRDRSDVYRAIELYYGCAEAARSGNRDRVGTGRNGTERDETGRDGTSDRTRLQARIDPLMAAN